MSFFTNERKILEYYDFERRCEIKSADEANNLLGVTKGEDDKSVIISYPHIVQVFTFLSEEPYYELKQEWTTNLRLSSGVTYDSDSGCYVGIFHGLSIRTWTSPTDDIQQADKYVFPSPILQIMPRENSTSLIIFKNGYCVPLPYGLENCKLMKVRSLIKDASTIEDTASYTRNKIDYLCYIVKDRNKQFNIVTCPLKDEGIDTSKVETVKVLRNDTDTNVRVTAKHIVASGSKLYPVVFFTWSDRKLSKYDITKKYWKHFKAKNIGPIQNEVASAVIEKNYFMFCGTAYYGNESSIGIPNFDPRTHLLSIKFICEKYDKKTKVFCPIKQFAVIADSKTISLWHLKHKKDETKQHKTDFDTVLTNMCRINRDHIPCFPVLGLTENKAWRRSKSNIYFPRNTYRPIVTDTLKINVNVT